MIVSATSINAPFVLTGMVKSYEASGGGPNSCLFSFYVTDGAQDASFQLRGDTPPAMFAAMAVIVAAAYAASTTLIQITSFERLNSGVYLVNLIRGA